MSDSSHNSIDMLDNLHNKCCGEVDCKVMSRRREDLEIMPDNESVQEDYETISIEDVHEMEILREILRDA